MTKHIRLTYTDGPWAGDTFTLDVDAFARLAISPDADLRNAPSTWMYAGLLAFNEGGEVELSPRGKDLLASIDCIPDDPAPEPAKPQPCGACGGTGEQALFISKHTCDGCGGTGNERNRLRRMAKAVDFSTTGVMSGRISSAQPNKANLPRSYDLMWQTAGMRFRWEDVLTAWRTRYPGRQLPGSHMLMELRESHATYRSLRAVGARRYDTATDDYVWHITEGATDYMHCNGVDEVARCQLTHAICELVWRGLIPGEKLDTETEPRTRLGYHATITPSDTIEAWHTDEMPEVGRHVEVEVRTGETLRGEVVYVHDNTGVCLEGIEAAPLERRSAYDSWWTWQPGPSTHRFDRMRWRYSADGKSA